MRTVNHLTADFFTLARAASAVFTTIGHANALADGGGQDGLIGIRGEGTLAGFDLDVECHTGYGAVGV